MLGVRGEAGLVRADGPPTAVVPGSASGRDQQAAVGARHQPSSCPRGLNTNLLTHQLHLLHPLLDLLLHPLHLLLHLHLLPLLPHLVLATISVSATAPKTGDSRCEAPSASHQTMVSLFFKATFSSIKLSFGPNLKQSCGL